MHLFEIWEDTGDPEGDSEIEGKYTSTEASADVRTRELSGSRPTSCFPVPRSSRSVWFCYQLTQSLIKWLYFPQTDSMQLLKQGAQQGEVCVNLRQDCVKQLRWSGYEQPGNISPSPDGKQVGSVHCPPKWVSNSAIRNHWSIVAYNQQKRWFQLFRELSNLLIKDGIIKAVLLATG